MGTAVTIKEYEAVNRNVFATVLGHLDHFWHTKSSLLTIIPLTDLIKNRNHHGKLLLWKPDNTPTP